MSQAVCPGWQVSIGGCGDIAGLAVALALQVHERRSLGRGDALPRAQASCYVDLQDTFMNERHNMILQLLTCE